MKKEFYTEVAGALDSWKDSQGPLFSPYSAKMMMVDYEIREDIRFSIPGVTQNPEEKDRIERQLTGLCTGRPRA